MESSKSSVSMLSSAAADIIRDRFGLESEDILPVLPAVSYARRVACSTLPAVRPRLTERTQQKPATASERVHLSAARLQVRRGERKQHPCLTFMKLLALIACLETIWHDGSVELPNSQRVSAPHHSWASNLATDSSQGAKRRGNIHSQSITRLAMYRVHWHCSRRE